MVWKYIIDLKQYFQISDQLLVNLRKPGETGYKIPVGGLFDYVTGANFFGEIVEWTGFALACNFQTISHLIFYYSFEN